MRTKNRAWYWPVLSIPAARSGEVAVEHVTLPAQQKIQLSSLRTAFYGQKPGVVSYPHETTWHKLVEDGQGEWMSDLPIEQRQCDDLIAGMRGDVLVGGLGLGYAVTALALRATVKRIVVVEKSADIIKLVWPHLKPYVHAKATIVHADLFDYLKRTTDRFRWGFYDIWQLDGESTFHATVVPLRRLSVGKVGEVRCWNEDIMRGQLLQGIDMRLQMLNAPGDTFKDIVSLDKLTADTDPDNVWIMWAQPFWKWYASTKPELTHAINAARAYVRLYGHVEIDEAQMHRMWG